MNIFYKEKVRAFFFDHSLVKVYLFQTGKVYLYFWNHTFVHLISDSFKMPFEEPLAFKVEWFDAASSLHRHFNFSFYQSDTSVEMFDTKLRKMFLKRCAISGLDRKELFVGNTIVVFSRHLLIKDYANEYTKDQVENDKQSTLILLYPDAHDQLGFVLDCLERGGYNLCRARSLRFTLVMFNFNSFHYNFVN